MGRRLGEAADPATGRGGSRLKYRPEIDGLRAIAVLPVILFHAGFDWFQGGYVGVDVFFVISGYLITSIIAADLQAGSFSFAGFYERRARRIFPALFLVCLASIPFAWAWLTPADMKDFSQSLLAITLFVSNILFWREAGYFDAEASLKPMLHTWSVSLEEQFYLVFPLFLVVLWRIGAARARLMGLLALAGLALSEWGARSHPAATYFLVPTRGWELLLGAMLALYHVRQRDDQTARAPYIWYMAAGGAGLALILFAILTFDQRTVFPGVAALLPTVGTLLIIAYGRADTPVGRFLASRPLVSVGLISYSAYLWQHPLFAFARQRSLWEPSALVMASLAVLAIALAYLSWRFVEVPFRAPTQVPRRRFIPAVGVAIAGVAAFGIVGQMTDGVFSRRSASSVAARLDERLSTNQGLAAVCDGAFTRDPRCRTSDEPELVLWGDSHAMHLAQGFIASRPDVKMVQFTRSVCAPVVDIAPVSSRTPVSWARDCIATNDSVLDWLRQHRSVRYAALGSPFAAYVQPQAMVLLKNGRVLPARPLLVNHLRQTIRQLQDLGIKVVLFSSPPENGKNIGRCLKNAYRFGRPYAQCRFPQAESDDTQAAMVALLREIEADVPVVWLSDGICSAGMCSAAIDSTFLYRDYGHLTHEGSALLGRQMNFYTRVTDASIGR